MENRKLSKEEKSLIDNIQEREYNEILRLIWECAKKLPELEQIQFDIPDGSIIVIPNEEVRKFWLKKKKLGK